MKEIILNNLPKISLNEWYAGNHWTKRTKIKEQYKFIIKSQFKEIFDKDNSYTVYYTFCFKNNPLDASNCVAMVKLIEDIIFESDSYKIIEGIHIRSEKSQFKKDYVKIHVYDKTQY